MPTENGELGTVYYKDYRTEEWIPFGGVKEVHIQCDDEAADEPAIPMAWGKELNFETMKPTTITIKLSRKAKRRLNRAFGLPEYKITEWCFPKKKRGNYAKKKKGTERKMNIGEDKCFWLSEGNDMGATVFWCNKTKKRMDQCAKCDGYISLKEVRDIVALLQEIRKAR